MTFNPTVSVVVPTYNRLITLQRVLKALGNQTYPLDRMEVVVVSDGSTDGTNDYLSQLAAADNPLVIRPVFQENQGVAAARNHGIAKAQGDIVVFIDDDVVPAPQLVAEHIRFHQEDSRSVIVLGPMQTPPDYALSPWVQWEQLMLAKQYDEMLAERWQPSARQFYTGNTSLAREELITAGGFDPRFRRAEDVELAYRLEDKGLCFLFNPQAVGYHYASRSFAAWIAIPYDYGRNDVIFTQEKGQTWLLPAIWSEFHSRHGLIRILTQVCLDRPVLSRQVVALLKRAAETGRWFGPNGFTSAACSALFNLRHYQGIADQLGGRDKFFVGARTYSRPYRNARESHVLA